MRRRRLPLLALLLAACAVAPASASAALVDVRIDTAAGPALCVSTNALASSVTVVVGRPGGGAPTSVVSATPQATACDGTAGRSFRPALPFDGLDGAAGATLAIADSTGDSVNVPFPVASFETATGGFSGRLHLRNLPAVAGTQITNGGSLPLTGLTAASYDGDLASPGSAVIVTATIGSTPFRANLAPRAFAADLGSADGATTVTVHGADPSGGPVAIELLGGPGGSSLASTSAPARIGSGLDATATLPLAATSGAVVTARQGAWSTTTQLGGAAFTQDGFSVSVAPSPPGCAGAHTCIAGSYDWSLSLHDPATTAGGADALGPCHALGPDVSGAGGCAAFPGGSARLAVTAGGELPVVDDAVSVTMTSASLGVGTLRLAATGVRGSLDDGSLHVRGTRRMPVVAAISSPRGALPPLKATRTVLTNASGVADLTPDRNPFALRVADGAAVSLSGAGVGSLPLAFSYRLAASISGAVLSGSAVPGARILVAHDQGTRIDRQVVIASGSGFAVTLRDPSGGDRVVVSAGDPATRGVTTLSLIVGGFAPRIQGLVDQQPVRPGVAASVAGLPADAKVLWGGDLPETLGGTSVTLPVERVPDGPVRVTATALAGPGTTDYLYVLVDSTAPTGGAGPDQTVPVGRRAVFVTQARDANGLAAVRFQFKAGGSGTGQPINQLGQPFRHVFSKAGTYAVTVTITDLAGNSTSDRAIVRVVKGLASALNGRWPGRATRRAGLKAKLSARVPGDLSVQIFRPNGRLAVTRTVAFDKPRVGKRLSFALKRLPPGRYLAVRQFVDLNGVAGPVVATPLVIT